MNPFKTAEFWMIYAVGVAAFATADLLIGVATGQASHLYAAVVLYGVSAAVWVVLAVKGVR